MYSHGHSLTIQAVETRWRGVSLAERAASPSHFTDLCDAFGDPTSADADITGSELKKRLRVNLYNACPVWPALLDHPALDCAAWTAYGRKDANPGATLNERILEGLLTLNAMRAG